MFNCRNTHGLVMKLTDHGAAVVSVETADRDGELTNITLDGQEDQLAVNNDPNHLHGGKKEFDAMVGKAVEVKTDDAVGVKLFCVGPKERNADRL